MMSSTRSSPKIFDNIRWVLSIEPTSQPVEETCSANSANNRSATFDLTLPRRPLRDLFDLLVIEMGEQLSRLMLANHINKMAHFFGPVLLR